MTALRRTWRLFRMFVVLMLGILIALLMLPMRRSQKVSEHFFMAVASWWHRRMLGAMGIAVRVEGEITPQAGIWISNHISWLDILVIGSQAPVHFVSKSEVRRWPIIGFLAAQTGTIFLQRGANQTGQIVSAMQEKLKDGYAVLFFPEGTTGHGHYVRRFHSRLFDAAIDLHAPIVPLALRYEHDPQPHPVVPYINQQSLLHNLWGVLALPRLQITLIARPALSAEGAERRRLSEQSREVIREALELPAPALPPAEVRAKRREKKKA
ncbi:MAG: 1-acyl-sn-glycerol-3-phosphate acyltransferase [Natronospirillum sp.]